MDDAIGYGQDFLNTWEEKQKHPENSKLEYSCVHYIKTHINILKEHDRTNDALKYSTILTTLVGVCCRYHKSIYKKANSVYRT